MALVQDLHYPTEIVSAINNLQQGTVGTENKFDNYFLSQPRRVDDGTWEIVSTTFNDPVSLSYISLKLLQHASEYQLYYFNRNKKRLPILDRSLHHYKGIMQDGPDGSWFTVEKQIYPVIATGVEVWIKRIDNGSSESVSLGVKDVLFKRNIYNAQEAMTPLEPSVDVMGNLVTKAKKEWSANQATDGNATTYWKSEPQPAPDAVVNYYMDVRGPSETSELDAQRIDRFWINPVYSGQTMNLYYTSDDTVGTHKLSTNKLLPVNSVNAVFKKDSGLGLSDSTSVYSLSGRELGYNKHDNISGVLSWTPMFDQIEGYGNNLDLTLLEYSTFKIKYSTIDKSISVEYAGSSLELPVSLSHSRPISIGFVVNFSVVDPDIPVGISIILDAIDDVSVTSVDLSSEWDEAFLESDSFDPSALFSFRNVEGYVGCVAFKDSFTGVSDLKQAVFNPHSYIVPDSNPFDSTSTTDNMLYAADFTLQEFGHGGVNDSMFTSKTWIPVWQNWDVERKFYFLPAPVRAKYLKFEFTNLLEQPYPIWESGIESTYQTYPISITKKDSSTVTTTDIAKTHSAYTQSSTQGIISSSSSTAYSQTVGYNSAPQDVRIDIGASELSNTIPHLYSYPLTTTVRQETSSLEYFTSSSSTRVDQQASDVYYTVVSGDWLIKIGARYNIPWQVIYEANRSIIDSDPRVKRLPKRSAGWWIFPGQQLRIPGAIMEQITTTETVTERTKISNTTTFTTQRFGTTEVHKYDQKTVKRDAAIAYFAGFSDIQIFRLNYLTKNDQPVYEWDKLDTADWVVVGADYTPSQALMSPGGDATITSKVFPSMSTFQKVNFSSVFTKPTKYASYGDDIAAVGITDDAGATWGSSSATWNDPVVTWGSVVALSRVFLDKSRSFEGRNAVKMVKAASTTPTDAGVSSKKITVDSDMNGRFVAVVFRTKATNNVLRLEVISDSTGDTVYEGVIDSELGHWSYVATDWMKMASQDVTLNIILTGEDEEELWISELSYEQTGVNFEASNDGGVTYHDVTQPMLNRQPFLFPVPDNDLRLRVKMFKPGDYIQSITAEPIYLQ